MEFLRKMTEFEIPKCDKCGAELTTGLMAAFCDKGKECEFWTPELQELLDDPGVVVVPI